MAKQMMIVEVTLKNYPKILHSLVTSLLADLTSKEATMQNPSIAVTTTVMLTDTLVYAAGVVGLTVSELPQELRAPAVKKMLDLFEKAILRAVSDMDKKRKDFGV